MIKLKNTNTKSGKDSKKLDDFYIACGNIKWYGHSRKSLIIFLTMYANTILLSNYTSGHLVKRNINLHLHKTCMQILAVSFEVVRSWKWSRCPSTGGKTN